MKIICLNTWGGRADKEALMDFIVRQAADTDVFCLQEIWAAPYEHIEGQMTGGAVIRNDDVLTDGVQRITRALPGFSCYFHPQYGEHYGLLLCVRNTLRPRDVGETYIYQYKGYVPPGDQGMHARSMQHATVTYGGRDYVVANTHALWNGQGKGDSGDRLDQSRRIISWTQAQQHPVVLCGDMNLNPDTESIRMLEEAGLVNLIAQYGITSTRTSHYAKPGKYADYVFVSPQVPVASFAVLPDEVSDHAPLQLEVH